MPKKKKEEPVTSPEIDFSDAPEDVKKALNVLVGNRPESFLEEFAPSPAAAARTTGAGFAGTSAQEEFIKKKDPVEQRIRLTENKVYVFDITKEEDKLEYERILDFVFDRENQTILTEPLKEPSIIIDPNSSAGYRAIVVVKTAKPETYVKPKGSGYSVAEKKK